MNAPQPIGAFAHKLTRREHFTGFVLSRLAKLCRDAGGDDVDRIEIDGHQANGAFGIHQARVRLVGDPNVYRLILAPVDAPIRVGAAPIGSHFALPMGDA